MPMWKAQAEDSNLFKKYIVGYLPLDMVKESVMPPIVSKDKSNHGWNHEWTARALCLLSKLERFDENPPCVSLFFLSFLIFYKVHIFRLFMKFVHEERDGYKMKASDLPSFLYPHGMMYDNENLNSGLFWGHFLIQVFFFSKPEINIHSYFVIEGLQLIYMGDSSVLTGHHAASKPSKVEKYGMWEIILGLVACIAMQVSFSFSCSSLIFLSFYADLF